MCAMHQGAVGSSSRAKDKLQLRRRASDGLADYRDVPSIDALLQASELQALVNQYGRQQCSAGLRRLQQQWREQIKQQQLPQAQLSLAVIQVQLDQCLAQQNRATLCEVYNLTGTVLHTNLGRALLPDEAVEAVVKAMRHPMNLEYDLETGQRGDRDALIESLLCELTGAEAATVVNNNAAAVFLMLNTLALKREVVVSRGELVEIGGAFRIPDIMKRAGAKLIEIGTTNRTHAKDYYEAIGRKTAMLMKVHCSNYEVRGFTKAVPLDEVAAIAQAHGLITTVDLGSGTLVDLQRWGLAKEVTVQETLAQGADLVTFSGDKLLGGPQAGLLVGRRDLIQRIKKNPLKRALRVGKLTLAALEEVLRLYRHPEQLGQRLPTLRLFTRPQYEIQAMAQRLVVPMQQWVGEDYQVSTVALHSQIGSGALPLEQLPSYGLAIDYVKNGRSGRHLLALEQRLRALARPVIGRIAEDRLLLDLRCLLPEEEAQFVVQLDGGHASV